MSGQSLFLVPKTKGNSNTEFLIEDLIYANYEMRIKNLHFTHYGFIQNKLPKNELEIIIQYLRRLSLKRSIKKIMIDVDKRFYKENLFEKLGEN